MDQGFKDVRTVATDTSGQTACSLTLTLTLTLTPNAAHGCNQSGNPKSEILNSKSQTNSKSQDENLRCRQNHCHGHKQIPTTGNAIKGSILRPGPFLSLVFLSFEFVWDLLLRISDFKHARRCAHPTRENFAHTLTLTLTLTRTLPPSKPDLRQWTRAGGPGVEWCKEE